jgi:hypothetical protein
MEISCKNCKRLNDGEDVFCNYCKQPLIDPTTILGKLAHKQELLEAKHQLELKRLKDEISMLRSSLQQQDESPKTHDSRITHTEPRKIEKVPSPKITREPLPKRIEKEIRYDPDPIAPPTPKAKLEPSSFELGLQKVLEPFHDGFALVGKLYNKYKDEGKLPIFFMTIAGILAILFGFGYLLQYSLKYLGAYAEVVKIGLGFAFAFSAGGIGIRLYKKNENYQEYGSALISLGLILNYLLIYFLSDLGNFPILSSSILGFSLIILNTGIAIFLSLRFQTKIIAVLFLLGGALAPFYLHSTSDGELYYLYLLLLTVGANIVAYRIEWKTLHYLSFIVSFGLLEMVVFSHQPNSLLFTIYYHLFAYLFFYYTLFRKNSIRPSLEKNDLIILSGNLSFLLYNLYTSHLEEDIQLGVLYLLNAITFGVALFRFWKKADPKIKLVFLILIGCFIGFAIPALVHHSLIGLFWSIEALVLIVLGFIYSIPFVRKEGYLILLIAFVKLGINSSLLFENWSTSIWHDGFLNYAILGGVIYLLWYAVQRFSQNFTSFETSLFRVCKEIIPIWLSSVFLISAYGLLGVWAFNLALIPLFGLIYWHKAFKTQYTDRLALLHFILLFASIAYSAIESQSIHFSDQFLYAQISVLELMISFWFLRKYYELLNYQKSTTFRVVYGLRVVFFMLLPLIFLHICRRHAIEYIAPAAWISTLIAYFMEKRLKFKALRIETNFLTIGAVLISFSTLNDLGLIAAIVSLTAILFLERAYKENELQKSSYNELLVVMPYLVMISISLLHFALINDNPGESALLFAFLLLTTVYFKEHIAVLNKSHKTATRMASFFNLAGLLFIIFEESLLGTILLAASLILMGLLLQNKKGWHNNHLSKTRWTWAVIGHQVQILLFYTLLLILLDIELDGILATLILVVHAILILFVSLKNQILFLNKISFSLFGLALLKILLNDIRDFNTAEKVIVFIVIGVLLLGASYAYLKLKKYFENQRQRVPVEEDFLEEK